jgi:site-specific recombinase XerD
MEEAEAAHHLTSLKRARGYRNGLMIAFLAVMPIRLKNFSAIRIGSSLVKHQNAWQLNDTKSGLSDECPVPRFLDSYIEKYIEEYRPLFRPRHDRLWVSTYGGDLSYLGCERIVTDTTRATLSIPMSPHLFRSSAASTAYLYAGDPPFSLPASSIILIRQPPSATTIGLADRVTQVPFPN